MSPITGPVDGLGGVAETLVPDVGASPHLLP